METLRVNKVGIISNNLPLVRCGVGDYSYLLGQYLMSYNYDISFFSKQNELIIKDSEIFTCVEKWDKKNLNNLLYLLIQKNINIVIVQYVNYSYNKRGLPFELINFFKKIRKSNIKIVFVVHEAFIRIPYSFSYLKLLEKGQRFILKKLLQQSHTVITSIEKYKSLICDCFDCDPHVIPIPSNVPLSHKNEFELSELKKRYKLEGFKVIATFGLRDHSFLVEVYRYVKKRNPYVKLFICGSFHNESVNYSDRDDIIFTGYLPSSEVSDHLNVSDIFILPDPVNKNGEGGTSLKSGSLAAALNLGLTIIGTKGDLNGSLLSKCKELHLVQFGNVEECGNLVLELLKRPTIRNSQFYETYLSWNIVSNKYNTILRQL